MGKRAFLVLGPERSGTRLLTKILIEAGCYGDDGHEQRLDHELPDEPLIVWRRSLPHRAEWPDVVSMIEGLRRNDYAVQVVVTIRDSFAMAKSQVVSGLAPNESASYANQETAFLAIFSTLILTKVPFAVVSYENLTHWPKGVIGWLVERLALPHTPGVDVYDANTKWFAEEK